MTADGLLPRPYQLRTLAECRAHYRDGKRAVLVVAPTGSGKTCMGSMAVAAHIAKGDRRAVWLAHRIELVEQAARALHGFGLEVGYRGLGASAPVQVCMVQTLARRDLAPDGTFVVVDEAHHQVVGGDWARVLRGYLDEGARVLGLTATPARSDDRALEGFDGLVVSTTIGELVDDGHLVPVRWMGPDRPTGKDRLAKSPAEAWSKHARRRPTVVFAPHVQAANDYCEEFRKVGARCEVVSERSTPESRAAVLMSLEQGALDVVCNVQVLTEGWDCPRVSCVIVARRIGSQALWVQMTGRGLRPHEGKRDCLLLDLCGMAHVLGLPDEARTYSLTGEGITLSRPAACAVRLCRVCGCQLEDGQLRCEECGKDHALVTPISVGGELTDWRSCYVRARDALAPSRAVLSLAGILRKAEAAHWHHGAALIRFKAIFKRHPRTEEIEMAKRLNQQADVEFRKGAAQ
jgi:DNA repair protein RadD